VTDPAVGARERVLLRFADAMMTMPGGIDDELRDELRRHLDDAQLLELTLDVMKWNYQKVPVALGVDDPVREGELTDLVFDADGNWVRPAS